MMFYKIREISTGLFLGVDGKFTKRGKVWGNEGHAKNAYNCRMDSLPPIEIVEFKAEEVRRLRPTEKALKLRKHRFTRLWETCP